MLRVSTRASLGLRIGLVALASTIALIAIGSDPADARGRRKYKRIYSSAASYEPRYADIVVDANTGDVLHSTQPDALRHPASLTKIMTLYLLFEQLEAGKLRLDTPLEVSAHASRQAPTKLGLRPGQTIQVEDAIKALVTKSANDAAVVIAEALADSEEEFATLMTRKARALRMSRTVYKNASGLPDPDQVTTARDQALLGLAIQDRFPRYYRYFATQSFAYRGVRMANHNRLLGRVDGVNGIKTGYTRASGFNLVSAVQRGDRRIVAVVLGGKSGGARDAKMRSLIEQKISLASVRRTAPKIVEIAEAAPEKPARQQFQDDRPARAQVSEERPARAQLQAEKPVRVASAGAVPTRAEMPSGKSGARVNESHAAASSAAAAGDQPVPGSTEPIRPLLVKTLSVKAGTVKTAAAMSLLSPEPIATRAPSPAPVVVETPRQEARTESLPPPPPGARPGVLGVLPMNEAPTRTASIAPVAPPQAAPALVAKPERQASVRDEASAAASAPKLPSGWIVQVGAFEDREEAKEKLVEAMEKAARLLRDAQPYTEAFAKGSKRYYRARFAGLRESTAEQACKQLQKSKIACFTVRN